MYSCQHYSDLSRFVAEGSGAPLVGKNHTQWSHHAAFPFSISRCRHSTTDHLAYRVETKEGIESRRSFQRPAALPLLRMALLCTRPLRKTNLLALEEFVSVSSVSSTSRLQHTFLCDVQCAANPPTFLSLCVVHLYCSNSVQRWCLITTREMAAHGVCV